MKIALHEEDEETRVIIESWYEEATRVKSIDEAATFAKHVLNDYCHDYGTICHSISAAAVAMAYGADDEPGAYGGITGFQAGFVMWGFIKHWTHKDNKTGLKLIDYDNMLYPQYESSFLDRKISKGTWEALQKEAEDKLKEYTGLTASDQVINHWKSIVEGNVPFGYIVEED